MEPRFILPPHPSPKIHLDPASLPMYEKRGIYVAQRKFNGTHVVIWMHEQKIVIWERRGKLIASYQLTKDMASCLHTLKRDPNKETVVVGELLHKKAKSKITNEQEVDNTIVLFDILVHDNIFLTEPNQVERLKLLADVCNNPTVLEPQKFIGAVQRALVVAKHNESQLWLAETFWNDFDYHYYECCDPEQTDKEGRDLYSEIEGLMLRIKDRHLIFNKANLGVGDVDWLLRVRKPKPKMYQQ